MIENSCFEEVGSDELIDNEIPTGVMQEAFSMDEPYREYIREYQNETSVDFEDLVNMS